MERGLNSNQIKLIAITAMTVDHLTWTFFPGFQTAWYLIALHIIGRLTAPIMWFFIAEGYHYTCDVKKYITRLFIFAFISHFAYCLAFGIPLSPFEGGFFNKTSVMWSLAWAVVLMAVTDSKKLPKWAKIAIIPAVCLITFPSDWSCIAVIAPLYIHFHRGNFTKQMTWMMIWTFTYALVYFIFIDKLYGALQLCTCLTVPILHFYNGKRGSWKGMKWLFYIYYPAHLALVGILRLYLYGDVPTLF